MLYSNARKCSECGIVDFPQYMQNGRCLDCCAKRDPIEDLRRALYVMEIAVPVIIAALVIFLLVRVGR